MRSFRRVLFAMVLLASTVWVGCAGFLWANETRLVYRSYVSRAAGCEPRETRGAGRPGRGRTL